MSEVRPLTYSARPGRSTPFSESALHVPVCVTSRADQALCAGYSTAIGPTSTAAGARTSSSSRSRTTRPSRRTTSATPARASRAARSSSPSGTPPQPRSPSVPAFKNIDGVITPIQDCVTIHDILGLSSSSSTTSPTTTTTSTTFYTTTTWVTIW